MDIMRDPTDFPLFDLDEIFWSAENENWFDDIEPFDDAGVDPNMLVTASDQDIIDDGSQQEEPDIGHRSNGVSDEHAVLVDRGDTQPSDFDKPEIPDDILHDIDILMAQPNDVDESTIANNSYSSDHEECRMPQWNSLLDQTNSSYPPIPPQTAVTEYETRFSAHVPSENVSHEAGNHIVDSPTVTENQEENKEYLLQAIIDSIGEGMAVKEQPQAELRGRYGSDGHRFLPNSRKKPMSITLPDLRHIQLPNDAQWGIVITMVTSKENPQGESFLHVNELVYRIPEAIQINLQSTFVPCTALDIVNQEKKFPRTSIVCRKLESYTFELTTFEVDENVRKSIIYTLRNEDGMTKVAKGKLFMEEYKLFCYKFVFQLAFKIDEKLIIVPKQCETHLVCEQKQPKTTGNAEKSSKKRKPNDEAPSARKNKKTKTCSPSTSSRRQDQEKVHRETSERRCTSKSPRNDLCGMASSA